MTRPAKDDDLAFEAAASAQAALMLVESLMLTLLERRVVEPDHLMEAIELTIATKRAAVEDEPVDLANASIGLLSKIALSLAAMPKAPAILNRAETSGRSRLEEN